MRLQFKLCCCHIISITPHFLHHSLCHQLMCSFSNTTMLFNIISHSVMQKVLLLSDHIFDHAGASASVPTAIKLKDEDNSDGTRFECFFCPEEFPLESSLEEHLLEHQPKKQHEDNTSLESSLLAVKIGMPIEGATQQPASKARRGPHQCNHCKAVFTQKRTLNVHMREHINKNPFHCTYCGRSFPLRCRLMHHIRHHTDDKPLRCEYCQKGFIEQSSLLRHKRQHTNDRPHRCEYCQRRFFDRCDLVRHVTQHTGNFAKTYCFSYF